MGKAVYIAEKPSVAKEFAKALKENFKSSDGYLESDNSIVTWCVGHLVKSGASESVRLSSLNFTYSPKALSPARFTA